jgi:hypothetical protein
MNPEEIRRALLAGQPVDWSEIDAAQLPDEEVAVTDVSISTFFGSPLPEGWQERLAAAVQTASPNSAVRSNLLRRLRERVAALGGDLPSWSWSLAVRPVAFRGTALSTGTRRGETSTILETDEMAVPVDISLSSDGSRLAIDVVGIDDDELSHRLRIAFGDEEIVILEPTRVTSGYVGFEVAWPGPLPADIVLLIVERNA